MNIRLGESPTGGENAGNFKEETEMKYAFVNGVILDGTQDMEPQSGKIILVDGEKITAIVDAGADTSGYEKIDLGGKYIMPGLINMHIHLPSSGKPKKKESDPKKLVKIMTSNNLFRKIIKAVCRSAAQMQLNSGVTTIRTVGGVENADSSIRDDINAGKTVGREYSRLTWLSPSRTDTWRVRLPMSPRAQSRRETSSRRLPRISRI